MQELFLERVPNGVYVGIDPGYDRCGFAIAKKADQSLEVLDWGYVTSKPETAFVDRLFEIGSDFENLLKKHKPQVVLIEEVFFSKNKKTSLNIAKVMGLLVYLSKKYKAEPFVINPLKVKKITTGNGRATKRQVEFMVKQIFKNQFGTMVDDVFDAFAVLYAGLVGRFMSVRG